MAYKRTTQGLMLRGDVWHIDKVVFGKRLCESTRSGNLAEAEALLAHRIGQARRAHLTVSQPSTRFMKPG